MSQDQQISIAATNKNQETLDFVRQHRNDDIRQLAFLADKYPLVDMPWALDQLRGRQMATTKLPSWANHDGIIYPPHLSMEQCSSEATAKYKQQLAERLLKNGGFIGNGTSLTDLTGGFGVDFSFLSTLFSQATYVERLAHLCETAIHNFQLLGLTHATVINSDGVEYLEKMSHSTVIFIDPARRDEHGRKTYSIRDCTPDVAQLCPTLLAKCDWLIIKLSPMLDWHEAVRELDGVTEVHIVSVANECKELLLVCSPKTSQALRIFCANDNELFEYEVDSSDFATPNSNCSVLTSRTLFLPNASIMKAGCFPELCKAYSLQALSSNSHLFVDQENTDESANFNSFPGRVFDIEAVTTMNKKELKKHLACIDRANIAVRNFPLTPDQLRKRLKLKDGGEIYIFGTTLGERDHILIITKKRR